MAKPVLGQAQREFVALAVKAELKLLAVGEAEENLTYTWEPGEI